MRNTFKRVGNNPQILSTGLFPVFTLKDSNNLFFHCAVAVCREKDNCEPVS
jgi:hypothetical protein